jgi:hypothetical protein
MAADNWRLGENEERQVASVNQGQKNKDVANRTPSAIWTVRLSVAV